MKIPVNIPKNPRKWVVIYGFKDGEAEYLSQAQYDIFMQAYNEGRVGVSIDGRPYRTNCITAKLAREYDPSASMGAFFGYHPEDQFEIILDKVKNSTEEDKKIRLANLAKKNNFEFFVNQFCEKYNLDDLRKLVFGGGEKNG